MAEVRTGGLTAVPPSLELSVPLQHVLCLLIVAAAIKTPLGVPLYFNGLLLILGLFAVTAVQAVQPVFLWPFALLAFGSAWAAATGVLSTAGPRLAQVALIVTAISLLARIAPRLFARYLVLLVPIAVLVLVVEPLLPEALYKPRKLFGMTWPRASGLHGEHNYNAMLMGALGVMLAQHRPKIIACVPFALALTAVSRGFLLAFIAWLMASVLVRHGTKLLLLALVLLFSQPLIVLALDALASAPLQAALDRLTSSRFPLWVAYAKMGLSAPLGVGYWVGPLALAQFDPSLARAPLDPLATDVTGRDAHSIYLQVFGEFGWFGYLLFAGFIGHVAALARRHAPDQLTVLMFVMTGYAFYDGLSDWAFWVPIGYVLAVVRQNSQQPAATPGGAP